MKRILVTGGAGYIGSTVVHMLIDKGYEVVIVDNMSNGDPKLVHEKAKLYVADLVDFEELSKVFKNNKFDAVIHIAGYKAVAESMKDPAKYTDNITSTLNILKLMVEYKIKKLIYSSSAAVYGEVDDLITEETPTKPCNFYGQTKLTSEKIIKWYNQLGFVDYTIFRYFNVVGNYLKNYIDENPNNVLPILLEAVIGKKKFKIFGKTYNTTDGTCIRDYVDVGDLGAVHIIALDKPQNQVYNVTTGVGTSVLEIVRATEKALNVKIDFEYASKREGDPDKLLASGEKLRVDYKWKPEVKLSDSIIDMYSAYSE